MPAPNQGDWPERRSHKPRPHSKSRQRMPPRPWLAAALFARISFKNSAATIKIRASAHPVEPLERCWPLAACRACVCLRRRQHGRRRVVAVWRPMHAGERDFRIHFAMELSCLVLLLKELQHSLLHFPSRQAQSPFAVRSSRACRAMHAAGRLYVFRATMHVSRHAK